MAIRPAARLPDRVSQGQAPINIELQELAHSAMKSGQSKKQWALTPSVVSRVFPSKVFEKLAVNLDTHRRNNMNDVQPANGCALLRTENEWKT